MVGRKATRTIPSTESDTEIVQAWLSECVTKTGDKKRHRPTASDFIASLTAYCARDRLAAVEQSRMVAILNDELEVEKVSGRFPRSAKERIWPGYDVTMPEAKRLRVRA